ncbi:MAG: imidazole glycerol phosphate synthase subunit HisF [Patescibacteria group bacterium]
MIPCLDIIEDKVVKGVNFQKMQVIGDAVKIAQKYYQQGADELVFLDIKATKDNKKTIIETVKKIAAKIFIPFTVGGGISSLSRIKKILRAGADKVSLNTAAVLNPQLINRAAKQFGSQAIVIAIDVKKEDQTYQVYIKAGTQKANLEAVSWAKTVAKLGAGEILLTSIDRDGTKKGYDIELLNKISKAVNIPVIASGGAGSKNDIKAALTQGQADAVLAASIFHQKKVTIKSLKNYLFKSNLPIRL